MSNMSAIKDFDYNLIKVFDATIATGNATRASHHLSVTPAAVSLALQRLQAFYKEELFTRSRNGLVPTARAKELHRSFSQAMELIHHTFHLQDDTQQREIRILGNESVEGFYLSVLFELNLLDDLFISFHRKKHHQADEIKRLICEGEIDLFVGDMPINDDNVETIVFERLSQFVMVCAVDNPLAELEKISAYNFYAAQHAVYQNTMQENVYSNEKSLLSSTAEYTGRRKIAYRSDSVNGMINVIEKSSMVGILPERLARFYMNNRQRNLVAMPLPEEVTFRPLTVYASWLRNRNKFKKRYDIKDIVELLRTGSGFRK